MNKSFFYKNFLLFSFLFIALITFYAKFISKPEIPALPENIDEKFDEKFLNINSMEKLDSLILTEFRKNHFDTARTVIFIDSFLRNRFYHSYSVLSLKDNWISVFYGKVFWGHFLFPVIPSNIIEYPMAACSQQGIIFQELLAHLNIPCSTIQFFPLSITKKGHYAVSVYYHNSWHFYDSNREPYIVDSAMPSIERIIETKLYEKMYSKPSNVEFQEFFKNKSYKRVDMVPFNKGKMHYFQSITAFLSSWLWLGLLAVYLLYVYKTRSKKDSGN